MNTIGNLIWLLFGGLISAIGYFFGGFILCLTIIISLCWYAAWQCV